MAVSKNVLRQPLYRELTALAREHGLESETDFIARMSGLHGQAREVFEAVAAAPRTSTELRREAGVGNVTMLAGRINARLSAAGDHRRVVCERTGTREFVWRISGAASDVGA